LQFNRAAAPSTIPTTRSVSDFLSYTLLLDLLQIFDHIHSALLHQVLSDFDCGGRFLKKIGREDFYKRGNNRATDCSTACWLTGDMKMRAAYLYRTRGKALGRFVNAPVDTVAIDDEDEQYSANHALFTSGIPQD
jgi:hypothetical protein